MLRCTHVIPWLAVPCAGRPFVHPATAGFPAGSNIIRGDLDARDLNTFSIQLIQQRRPTMAPSRLPPVHSHLRSPPRQGRVLRQGAGPQLHFHPQEESGDGCKARSAYQTPARTRPSPPSCTEEGEATDATPHDRPDAEYWAHFPPVLHHR
jgi:hypothetical protein